VSFLEEPEELSEYMAPLGTKFKPGTTATRSVSLLHLQIVSVTDMILFIPDSNKSQTRAPLNLPLSDSIQLSRAACNKSNFIYVALI
jgi:hypothetical protein